MLKQLIKYTDFDGIEKQQTFWFHMTKAEIAKSLLTDDGGLERRWRTALESDDKARFILVFDELVKMSIGKRDDELGFGKPKGYAEAFMASEAYSQMFMDLVEKPETAIDFFNGIFPANLLKEAQAEMLKNKADAAGIPTLDAVAEKIIHIEVEEPKKSPKPGHEYTMVELQAMSSEEFKEWEKRTPPQSLRPEQLQYAYMRRITS